MSFICGNTPAVLWANKWRCWENASSETQKWFMWSLLSVTSFQYRRQSQAMHNTCVFSLTTFPLSTILCDISQKLFVKLLSQGPTAFSQQTFPSRNKTLFSALSCLWIAGQILCPLPYVLYRWYILLKRHKPVNPTQIYKQRDKLNLIFKN